jgi:uncharacterized protein YegJ (DUF2314 family)
MRIGNLGLLALAAFAFGLGCSRTDGQRVHRDGEPDVEFVAEEDTAMNTAMATARSTLDQFVVRLTHPGPSQRDPSLKIRISEGEIVEHIWATDIRYEDGRFSGRINNEPLDITRVRLGDSIDVTPDQVSDWMVVDGGRLVGGYTIRVLRDRMSTAERAELDRSLNFRIE